MDERLTSEPSPTGRQPVAGNRLPDAPGQSPGLPSSPQTSGGHGGEEAFENVLKAANSAFAAEDYDNSFMLYSRALEMRPDDVTCLARVGLLYIWYEQAQPALSMCRRAVALAVNSAEGWLCVGGAYFGQGDFAASADAARKSLALNSEDVRTWMILGESLAQLGDKRGAMQVYDEIKKRDPEQAAQFKHDIKKIKKN